MAISQDNRSVEGTIHLASPSIRGDATSGLTLEEICQTKRVRQTKTEAVTDAVPEVAYKTEYRCNKSGKKVFVFWDVSPRSLTEIDRRLSCAYCLHQQGN
jgi:DNA-directed RNA polymerase subunit RPC12/RpoP